MKNREGEGSVAASASWKSKECPEQVGRERSLTEELVVTYGDQDIKPADQK